MELLPEFEEALSTMRKSLEELEGALRSKTQSSSGHSRETNHNVSKENQVSFNKISDVLQWQYNGFLSLSERVAEVHTQVERLMRARQSMS